jgi:hypothetical protein
MPRLSAREPVKDLLGKGCISRTSGETSVRPTLTGRKHRADRGACRLAVPAHRCGTLLHIGTAQPQPRNRAFALHGKMYNEAYLDGIAKSWHAAHKHTRQLDGHSKKVRSRPAASVCCEVSACRCCVHRMQCQVHSVAWNCTGKRIASGSVDQTARIWTMAEGRHVKDIELRGHQDSVDQLRWDPGNADILSKHTSAVQMRFSLSASVHSHGWRG